MRIGQPKAAPLVFIDEMLVIHAQQVQHRRLKVVDMDGAGSSTAEALTLTPSSKGASRRDDRVAKTPTLVSAPRTLAANEQAAGSRAVLGHRHRRGTRDNWCSHRRLV